MSLPYPKSIYLILINEYFERFSFYGIKTTLPIFLKNGIGYDEDTATVIFHLFFMFCYFTPLLGATIADCFIGNYRTIISFTMVYIVGNLVLALSAIPTLDLPTVAFAVAGLVLIALGVGGVKPCISTFGGDQFKLPMQAVQQLAFFAIFNWIIAAANLSATFIAPMLRSRIHCFGETTCFSLSFFVALAFLILSLVFIVAGRTLYYFKEQQGNIIVRVIKCICTAISSHRCKQTHGDSSSLENGEVFSNTKTNGHWLDASVDQHGRELVEDIEVVLRLLPLYMPLCCFWALYDQQSSRWTFQASRMDRKMFGFTFEPDQFQIAHRILLLIFIPVFEKCIYPLLKKCNLMTSQLSRIFWGGIAAAVAFIMTGILEIYLKGSSENSPTLHILWQLPQFFLIVVAEIMFQISGMEFSYSEAPRSMKSLMQSIWLLTRAFGNLIVVLIAKFKFFNEQEYEFFLFSGLMFLNMLFFAGLSRNYKKQDNCQDLDYMNKACNELDGTVNKAFEKVPSECDVLHE